MEKTLETTLASTAGKLLRDNFGKGPGSIYVSIGNPFITMYLRDFLAPMEKVLLDQGNPLRVQETRDALMKKLIPEIQNIIVSETNEQVKGIYYDWCLDKKTGVIFAEFVSNDYERNILEDYPEKDDIHEEINRFTEQAQKTPGFIHSYKLNTRTIVSKRDKIFVEIEQELIRSGFNEQLRLAKRKLEKSLINKPYLEDVLGLTIDDIFVDWDFSDDAGYVILILNPTK
ncbi:DUF2294 domain-containing protein [Oceanobacillus manasiensis]|uniref:DUF2294 domain-containing protein n=1 Tax=Oceanobacillus manasiensis TaxID=586413 RepID=UPI0005A85858|nr:Na-translocating system protein MpsC family protein [Oceanobacillus manasiensis]